MLRFTQENACLRTSAEPVDMPEEAPQTPQFRLLQVDVLERDPVCLSFTPQRRRTLKNI